MTDQVTETDAVDPEQEEQEQPEAVMIKPGDAFQIEYQPGKFLYCVGLSLEQQIEVAEAQREMMLQEDAPKLADQFLMFRKAKEALAKALPAMPEDLTKNINAQMAARIVSQVLSQHGITPEAKKKSDSAQ